MSHLQNYDDVQSTFLKIDCFHFIVDISFINLFYLESAFYGSKSEAKCLMSQFISGKIIHNIKSDLYYTPGMINWYIFIQAIAFENAVNGNRFVQV